MFSCETKEMFFICDLIKMLNDNGLKSKIFKY